MNTCCTFPCEPPQIGDDIAMNSHLCEDEDIALDKRKGRIVIQDGDGESPIDQSAKFPVKLKSAEQQGRILIPDGDGESPIDQSAKFPVKLKSAEQQGRILIPDGDGESPIDQSVKFPVKLKSAERGRIVIQDGDGESPIDQSAKFPVKLKSAETDWTLTARDIQRCIDSVLALPLSLLVYLRVAGISSIHSFKTCRILMFYLVLTPLGVSSGDTKDSHLPGSCPRGTFLAYHLGHEICSPCPEGTFMMSDHHQYKACKLCSRPNVEKKQHVEIECTPTTDARIGCLNGYHDHSHIDDDAHGNNDPDCRPKGAFDKQVTAAPENKASASGGSVTAEVNMTAEVNVTAATDFSLHNVTTTADTGFCSLGFYIILVPPVIIFSLLCFAVFKEKNMGGGKCILAFKHNKTSSEIFKKKYGWGKRMLAFKHNKTSSELPMLSLNMNLERERERGDSF